MLLQVTGAVLLPTLQAAAGEVLLQEKYFCSHAEEHN
jgi:hypothetical protein